MRDNESILCNRDHEHWNRAEAQACNDGKLRPHTLNGGESEYKPTLVERLATAPLRDIKSRRDPKFSRAAARSAAHWGIAVMYQTITGRVPRGTSAEAFEEIS